MKYSLPSFAPFAGINYRKNLKSFKPVLVLSAGLLVTTICTSFYQSAEPAPPNIILILADDMGYSDLGCYGGEAATPNLDGLAKEGLRYTQIYNMSRCCPTRAALLSGLYPHNAGMGWMTSNDYHLPGYRGNLTDSSVTIAEALKTVGYESFLAGKWHVNYVPNKTDSKATWPLQRGFDKFYGILLGAANYYDPGYLCRDNKLITTRNDEDYKPKDYYFTDAITDNSVKYLKERKKDKPFFMYVAYTAAHWPMQAPESAIQKYKGRFDAGWEKLREQRLARMKKLGVIDPATQLSPGEAEPWADEKNKPAMLRRMETYAAMIDVMDQGIGRIMNELKAQGVDKNTVVIFLQDNGACAELVGNGPTRPLNANIQPVPKSADELTTSNNPPTTRDGKQVMQGRDVMAGPADTYLAYLKEWANVSNTPFRMYKHDVMEGGISTPMIVRWPDGIKQPGGIRKQVGHVIDILPTILDLAHASYPSQYQDRTIKPVNGISLVPTISNAPVTRKALFWEHEMNKAVRMGKWKLVSENLGFGRDTIRTGPWELYDVEEDRTESHNLASAHPDIVKQMKSLWYDYANHNNVYPSPWKEAKP